MKDFSFVAIDFETANESRLSACSIGLALFDNGSLTESRHWYLSPAVEGEFKNTWIHGIRAEDCRNQGTFKDLWRELEGYLHNRLIVAHNAAFDLLVLNDHCKHYNMPHSYSNFACTLSLAKQNFSNFKNYKLETLCDLFGIDYGAHSAEKDAISCGYVFQKLLNVHHNPYSLIKEVAPVKIKKTPALRESGINLMPAIIVEVITPKKNKFREFKPADLDGIELDDIFDDTTPDFFNGKSCIVTGLFYRIDRDKILKIITDNNGKNQVSVSGNTQLVIVGADPGWSKIDKVRELQKQGKKIFIIDESELIRILEKLDSFKA